MEQLWKQKRDFNLYVDSLAYSAVRRFYPTSVAKFAKIPLDLAFKYLIEMAQMGQLKLIWELRCPEYTCGRTVHETGDNSFFPDEVTCVCGNNFEVDSRLYFPAFEISEEYREYIRYEKKKKDKKTSLQLSLH